MGDADLFTIEDLGDRVASLRIATDRDPHMTPIWADGFTAAMNRLAQMEDVCAVVLEGGNRTFSAGASRELLLGKGADDPVPPYIAQAGRAARALLDLPVPVIAAAAGHAIGGGLLLGLWCDALVLAEESLYGANFMALGFTPGMGATWAVPDAFGATLGREMLMTGRLMTGRAIREAGCPLSHAVRPRDEARRAALALAREMAEAPRPAITLLKQTLARPRKEALERAIVAEREDHIALFSDPRTFQEVASRYPGPSFDPPCDPAYDPSYDPERGSAGA